MQPTHTPDSHALYHDRQYPPYAPPAPNPREAFRGGGVLPQLAMAAVALLAAFGLARMDGVNPAPNGPSATTQFQPSEAAIMYSQREPEPSPEAQEPLHLSLAEQELIRALAELDVEMGRTERMAEKLGQEEAFETLRGQHESLSSQVADRALPWKDSDRAELERRVSVLRTELARFSMELQEIATVQL